MARLKDWIQWQTVHGAPVETNGFKVTPVSQQLVVGRLDRSLPEWGFTLVWRRPAAVLVEGDGRRQRLPILDITRLIQAALFAGVVMILLIQKRQLTKE